MKGMQEKGLLCECKLISSFEVSPLVKRSARMNSVLKPSQHSNASFLGASFVWRELASENDYETFSDEF